MQMGLIADTAAVTSSFPVSLFLGISWIFSVFYAPSVHCSGKLVIICSFGTKLLSVEIQTSCHNYFRSLAYHTFICSIRYTEREKYL